MENQINATNSLAHTKWNCNYHIVFAPKYRRKAFFAEEKKGNGDMIRQPYEWREG